MRCPHCKRDIELLQGTVTGVILINTFPHIKKLNWDSIALQNYELESLSCPYCGYELDFEKDLELSKEDLGTKATKCYQIKPTFLHAMRMSELR